MKSKIDLFEQLKLSKDKVNHLKGGKQDLPTGGRLDTMIVEDIIF